MSVRTRPVVEDVAAEAMSKASEHLLSLQHPAGWWKGELETNVTIEAEDLMLRAFLGVLTDDLVTPTAAWIRSKQREDGTWANFWRGPGELSTTVEAYAALRLAGDPSDAAHMRRAREWILARGGMERARVFTRLWMALFGWWPWERLPAVPPEFVLLPDWIPLNVYDFACWARQTMVPIAIVSSLRPVRRGAFDLAEIRTGGPPPARRPLISAKGLIERGDDALRTYARAPNRWLRDRAMRTAVEWILRRQEDDGSWGGIQPPWVYSMIALNLMGYATDHPVMRRAFEGLERFTILDPENRTRRLEACQSPVWDTCLSVIALADAGVAPDDPALVRAADWLLGKEIHTEGDWTIRRPALSPGGWSFEFENQHYPDIDDAAEVILSLRRVRLAEPARARAAVERGVAWTIGMQSGDGGWGAFDVDNTTGLCRRVPFCDFGEVIDPPSADVTAHVVEMLAAQGLAGSSAARRALGWLARRQEDDGSWFGRWGANHVYGLGAVVPAVVAAGVSPTDPRIRRAVRWLERNQNPDGGWGEDLRSYRDDAWIGRGSSTASQTAWALLALIAAGERSSATTTRGVEWLVETQLSTGTWNEPEYTGTGFPGDFYINYHLYRIVFPIQALGRFVNGWQGAAA
ncbi:MAG TPA: squalene--hopene cyclase [Actinomycetota bacterium]|nr:squalene--hopene cyclase [Actinomycetota bacterium]